MLIGAGGIMTFLKFFGMRKLIFHSNQINTQVDRAFLKLLDSNSPTIGYIPSKSDLERSYFNERKQWYKQFGITNFIYFDLDKEFNKDKIEELLSTDAIFLSGGDTRYFLNLLQKNNFIPKLRDYIKNGGILIGASAGAILMTPNIEISELDHSYNTPRLKNMSSLNLVDFEFYPHLNSENCKEIEGLKKYSLKTDHILYACKDGEGIVIHNDDIQFIGKVKKIQNGMLSTV